MSAPQSITIWGKLNRLQDKVVDDDDAHVL